MPTTTPMLTFERVQALNEQRCEQWHQNAKREWSLLEWCGAMCGEAGEAANVAKKMLRAELNMPGNAASDTVYHLETDAQDALGKELAGTVLYAFLAASHAGIDMAAALRKTFNDKSEALGFTERL